MTTRSLFALAALAVSLTACGGSDGPSENNGPNGQGTFSGTITGDISKSVSGDAVFGSSAINNGFGLLLGNENDGFIFGREIAGIPGVGEYPIFDLVAGDEEEAPASNLIGVIGLTASGTEWICIPNGGKVNITSSSSSRIAGTVNLTAECYRSGSEVASDITLVGTFSAVGGDVD